jgi:dipeptidyl-peptidase 4
MPIELTLERVAHYPLPGMNVPAALAFSPDGRMLSYLWSEDGSLVRQLWGYDLEFGERRLLARAPGDGDSDTTVSPEEALRRERLRMRGFGITSYAWAKNKPVLLVPVLGKLLLSRDHGEPLLELATDGPATSPQLSPDGSMVAFVRDGDLWLIGSDDGARPRRVTFDAERDPTSDGWLKTNGLAEFIAQEEMGRGLGFWWAPDSRRIAFAQVDVSPVTSYRIAHDTDDPPGDEVHRYPFAGGRNANVRLGILEIDEAVPHWVPPAPDDVYLARVDWAPNGSLYYQVESRDQKRLDLFAYEEGSETPRLVLTERAEPWLNLNDDLRFLPRDGDREFDILWSSERSGFRHLYLYSSAGDLLRQLTGGEWPVDRVVDARGDYVYFLAGRESPLERQLYRTRLTGSSVGQAIADPERISADAGVHSIQISPSGDDVADLWDSATSPPRLEMRGLSSSAVREILPADRAEAEELGLQPPEFLTLPADDGTLLYAALYPPARTLDNSAPLIVSVYGGPHVQQVANSWSMTVDLRAQTLTRDGYAVLKLDNRGSARRGLAFESTIAGHLGAVEVADQIAGVRAASRWPNIDTRRVGVYGWSYGGYMTVMCMLHGPDVFHAGVAGAPVTDWDGYDTHYTERYLGTPSENAEGYRQSSALTIASSLTGDLLIVHGMIDENVHFRHSVRLADAFIAARRPFRLLPFPHERHMPRREEDRVFMEQQIFDHFRRCLPVTGALHANR